MEARSSADDRQLLACAAPAVSLPVSSSGITEECPGEENAQSPTTHHLFDFFFIKPSQPSPLNCSKSTTTILNKLTQWRRKATCIKVGSTLLTTKRDLLIRSLNHTTDMILPIPINGRLDICTRN